MNWSIRSGRGGGVTSSEALAPAFACSTSRSAAAPRASAPCCSPAQRCPAALGATLVAAPVECVAVALEQSRGVL